MENEAWGHPLKSESKEFVLPRTLADIVKAETLPTTKISIEKDEIHQDLLNLRDYANQSFMILSQFTEHHNLGLALNKVAIIINKADELLKKYE